MTALGNDISFGDNVRILRTPETEKLGLAEMIGNVYGETMPSETKAGIIGGAPSDYAFSVYFESLDRSYWFAPHLLEFVNHAPGTEVFVHGSEFKSVRQRDGSWKRIPVNPAGQQAPMLRARLLVAIAGILLPYLARLPRGLDFLRQYTDAGLEANLSLGAFNAVAWGALIAVSFLFRRPATLLIPCLPGFGFLAWGHFNLDLAADAQAGVALVFLPLYALAPIAVGAVLGYAWDRRSRK